MQTTNDELIDCKIKCVMRQTTYGVEEALTQLKLHNMDEMQTIKTFINAQKMQTSQPVPVVNVNQEVFRQFRTMLDQASKSYRDKNPIDINDVRNHFANETN